MSDISDRFSETLECGCEFFTGQWFLCEVHQAQPVHSVSCDICGHPDHTQRGWCRMMGPADGVPCPCVVASPHSAHRVPMPGCDLCDSAMDEARALQSERPWEDA